MNNGKKPVLIFIPSGASITQISKELEIKGVNRQAYYFLLLIQSWGKPHRIKAGEYEVMPGTTLKQFLKKLEKGQVMLHKITFPEGWTFQQFMAKLAAEPKLLHTLKNQTGEGVMAMMGHPGQNPEGLFYPDTYLFTAGTKDIQILRLSYELMQKKLQQAWNFRAANLFYRTPYEALIVASLIEKEAVRAKERAMVASVILQRLKIGMRLQIDASVLYGVNPNAHHLLTKSDLTTDTPYNTYTRFGLPPTPIAMPGAASIYAALHPVVSSALYYVAKGDGSHIFSPTLQAHLVAVKTYRRRAMNSFKDSNDFDTKINVFPLCFSASLLQHYWRSL